MDINYTFKVDGFYNSVNYYRSTSPMNIGSMPSPIATGITDKYYADVGVPRGKYYVRFSSVKADIEKFSDEIIVYPQIENVFLGSVASPLTTTTSAINLAVPVGAKTGDWLCAIAICRNDRTMSFPAGWSVELNTLLGGTSPRVYIAKKQWVSETSVTITHSANASCSAVLHLLAGDVVAVHSNNMGGTLSFTKLSADNSIMRIHAASGFGGSQYDEIVSLASLRNMQGYTNTKETYYHAGDYTVYYYYYIATANKITSISDPLTTSVFLQQPSYATCGIFALEIAQPI